MLATPAAGLLSSARLLLSHAIRASGPRHRPRSALPALTLDANSMASESAEGLSPERSKGERSGLTGASITFLTRPSRHRGSSEPPEDRRVRSDTGDPRRNSATASALKSGLSPERGGPCGGLGRGRHRSWLPRPFRRFITPVCRKSRLSAKLGAGEFLCGKSNPKVDRPKIPSRRRRSRTRSLERTRWGRIGKAAALASCARLGRHGRATRRTSRASQRARFARR